MAMVTSCLQMKADINEVLMERGFCWKKALMLQAKTRRPHQQVFGDQIMLRYQPN